MWFMYGPPTPNPFGRDQEIAILTRFMRDGQPVSLIGPRRIGKTSVLLASLNRSSLPHVMISVEEFVRGEKGFNLAEFISAYINNVTVTAYSYAGYKFQFMEKTKSYLKQIRELIGAVKITLNIPELIALIDLVLDKAERGKNLSEEFSRVLDLPQMLAEKLGIQRMVIALDEFQYLKFAKQTTPEIFHVMRSKWQFQRNVTYVISGSSTGMLREIINTRTQPFYQYFYLMRVNPMDADKSKEFLKRGFEAERVNVTDKEVEEIVSYVHGFPAWLNLVGIKVVVERRPISVILSDLPHDDNVINALEADLRKLSSSARSVLTRLANLGGEGSPKDLGDNTWVVNRALSQLMRYGYVEKEERGIYTILDPMIVHYLNKGNRSS
ncbi:ATP-binding protein [Metallosphaera hakonensis JCM 8857 = DSM 7519]|uniref:ATP-binding protein n=2 Tax=Metallosphaera hakonensis TaxID=79601 RepID=A0A2U9IWW7_9CREN|nr:ATP-binding protein [Metallosphaera hakonensis JCM 8857 = DSM 7519]